MIVSGLGCSVQALIEVCGLISSCGAWASLPCSMWDFPRPGTEPASPALADSLLWSQPGKPRDSDLTGIFPKVPQVVLVENN